MKSGRIEYRRKSEGGSYNWILWSQGPYDNPESEMQTLAEMYDYLEFRREETNEDGDK